MLHDPTRHEALLPLAWDESLARAEIERIVADTVARFEASGWWPIHPKDIDGDDPSVPPTTLYFGAIGTAWAVHYLQAVGACSGQVRFDAHLGELIERNRAWLKSVSIEDASASYLMGDLPALMMVQEQTSSESGVQQLLALIDGNINHPARELMWGSPGTLLAALFLHQRFGDERFAEAFRHTAAHLRSQLKWSEEHGCHYWDQDLYGRNSSYLDAVHGYAATAAVLIRGRHLLPANAWATWQHTIVQTMTATAQREDGLANWPAQLISGSPSPQKKLMQFCHGSPGFVICLADLPDPQLDGLLLAAGEATWVAGPLAKGSNLCHGTGGNGYAFLKLYERTGDARWLERARAFAMHGIQQVASDEREYGQLRYSLWTGDPGLAVYLWDCIRARAAFPTLDVFYAS